MSNIAERIAKLPPNRQQLLARLLQKGGINLSQAVIMPRVRNKRQAPLSFSQQRLWLFLQMDPDNVSYNVPQALLLKGNLQIAALTRSFSEIVRRHEVLRTTFQVVAGQPMQIIGEAQPVTIELVDLRQLSLSERNETAERLITEEAWRPFDLARGPLLRLKLLQLADSEHVLLTTLHHIISDGWSSSVLLHELTTLYTAFCVGQSSPLTELRIQYADFAIWQRDWISGQVLEEQLSYWREKLSGALPVLELPTDRLRPAVQSYRGATEALELPETLSRRLKSLSNDEGATLFMTLLAAFKVLIHRYTGQTDLCIGIPIANRNRAETENLIGFFVNNLVLRTDLKGNPTFASFLAQVREETLNAYAHQDLPFDKLVEELRPDRSLSYRPLFQLMFTIQNAPPGDLVFADLEVAPADFHVTTTKYDLSLFINETESVLSGLAIYNSDLFDASTIRRLLNHYENLLEGVVADPQQRIAELPLLTREEQVLFAEVNDTSIRYANSRCIHELFTEQAASRPGGIALVCDGRELSYGELNGRADALAHRLRHRGVGPETIVGIFMDRSFEMVTGLLGVLKAGAAYLPLDLNYPKQRLALMLEEAHVGVVLTEKRWQQTLPEFTGEVLCLDRDLAWTTEEKTNDFGSFSYPESLAFVFYTSGSTGKPKGVMAMQRSAVNYLASIVSDYQISAGDVVLQMASLSFDASVRDILGTLIAGAKLGLVPNEEVRDPFVLLSKIKQHGVTCILSITPTMLRSLADAAAETGIANDTLRLILTSGESLALSECARVRAAFGDRVSIANQYGATECTMSSIRYRVPLTPSSGVALAGKPIANSQVYVLDHRFRQCPVGVPGEVHLGGVGVARGYLGSPDLTALKYIPDPFAKEPGARLYRTGDRGRLLLTGDLELHGRIDRQLKVRGIRVEPGEIESVLKDHENVRDAAVVVREAPPGHQRLVGYVVLRQSNNDLRSFLKARVPDHMVPALFIVMDRLPLTPNGKVDYDALPIPDQSSFDSAKQFVAPLTQVEQTLAQIWTDILGLARIGIHDNFFELGGHSLLATQIITRIRKAFGVDLPLRAFFDSPTVASLSETIDSISRTESEEIGKLARLLEEIDHLSTDETRVLLEGAS